MPKPRRPYREVSAGGVVFRRVPEEGLRFLLIKDSYDKWGLPKGHLEDANVEGATVKFWIDTV